MDELLDKLDAIFNNSVIAVQSGSNTAARAACIHAAFTALEILTANGRTVKPDVFDTFRNHVTKYLDPLPGKEG